MTPVRWWLEATLLVLMIVLPAYTLYKRFNQTKTDGNPMGLSQRVIQLIALLVLVPAVMILGLENILPKDALVTLFGTIVGYSLSGLTKDS